MEKAAVLKLLKLLHDRVENNECTGSEMKLLSDGLSEAVNPLMTRKELAAHFGKSENEIDTIINRKLPKKFKIRNIVLYPYIKIAELFK